MPYSYGIKFNKFSEKFPFFIIFIYHNSIYKVKNLIEIENIIKKKRNIIARGFGRSYGDSANNEVVIDTTQLNKILEFNNTEGIITCESGVSIQEINKLTINRCFIFIYI